MSADVSAITTGPASFKLDSVQVGHTQGGIQCTVTPQNRPRNVDQYGGSEIAIIHTGDEFRMTIPFNQWDSATISEVYNPGNDQTGSGSGSDANYMGIGRSAGYIHTTKAAMITPFNASLAAQRIEVFKATPIGSFELTFDAESDRIFNTEFAGLVDPTRDDGELIARIQVA